MSEGLSGPALHPTCEVHSEKIGRGTRVWQFTIVLSGASIGEDCNIGAHCFIESDVIIGNKVTIKNGVSVWDGLRIGNNVFIGPNVVFTNDKHPRSRSRLFAPMTTLVKDGASIGAGAVILPGVTLEENCLVGAGSVVTKSVPANTVVVGNPAKVIAKTSL